MNAATVFTWPLRVYWEDTDASGVVYHANYLRWFERARTEWLRARGYDQERLRVDQGVAFTVASVEIRYLLPARLDDALEVEVRIEQARRASLVFGQTIHRVADRAQLSTATVRVGCVDAVSFRPKGIPFAL